MTDILIVGAGVVGCALARALSRYRESILVLEAGYDVASGASKANSGIVHAGFDAKPGSLKAKTNVEGAKRFAALCKALSVPYAQNGALVLGFSQEDLETLCGLLAQGSKNGVSGLRLLSREEALALEPGLNPEIVGALHAPTSAITSPYELTYALADHAALGGVRFAFGERVEGCWYDGLWHVTTGRGTHEARILVNCAGTGGGVLHNAISPRKVTIVPRRGQYRLYDRMNPPRLSMTLFQCPTKMGKGVLVTPTVHGNLMTGPTAEDIPDGEDTATSAQGLATVQKTARRSMIAPMGNEITSFSGIRAHAQEGDFLIGRVDRCEAAYEAIGIESPGLSAAPAIAEMLCEQIAEDMRLEPKAEPIPYPTMPKPFFEMDEAQRREAIARDPAYGNVVCRCEEVTEAEIRAAIRRPVGARSIDGVKRRVRAGMGRCQGGFCSPRVAEILAEELGISLLEVTKSGGASPLFTGTMADALKEGR